jgi:hypothetical protein
MRSRFANVDYEPQPLDRSEQYETGLKRVGEHTNYAQEDLAFDEGQSKGTTEQEADE